MKFKELLNEKRYRIYLIIFLIIFTSISISIYNIYNTQDNTTLTVVNSISLMASFVEIVFFKSAIDENERIISKIDDLVIDSKKKTMTYKEIEDEIDKCIKRFK